MVFLLKKSTCASHLGLLIPNFLVMSVILTKLFMGFNKHLVPGSVSLATFFCPMVLFVPPETHPCLCITMVLPLWSYSFMSMTLFSLVVHLLSFITWSLFFPISLLWRTWMTYIIFWVCRWYETLRVYFYPTKNISMISFTNFICILPNLFIPHPFLEPHWPLQWRVRSHRAQKYGWCIAIFDYD